MNKEDAEEVNSILKDPEWQGQQAELYAHTKKCEICSNLAQMAMLLQECVKMHMMEKLK